MRWVIRIWPGPSASRTEQTGTAPKTARNMDAAPAVGVEDEDVAAAVAGERTGTVPKPARTEDAAPAVGTEDEDVAAAVAGERLGTIPKPVRNEAATAAARPSRTAYSAVKSVPT